MTLKQLPTRHPLTDETGSLTLPWLLYFNQTLTGDSGSVWEPTIVSLTEVGTPTLSGRYYKISASLVYFNILITPATSTASTAGTTYIDNFPLETFSNGVCIAVTDKLGGNTGMVETSSNRVYTPGWTATTTPVNVIGIVEAT